LNATQIHPINVVPSTLPVRSVASKGKFPQRTTRRSTFGALNTPVANVLPTFDPNYSRHNPNEVQLRNATFVNASNESALEDMMTGFNIDHVGTIFGAQQQDLTQLMHLSHPKLFKPMARATHHMSDPTKTSTYNPQMVTLVDFNSASTRMFQACVIKFILRRIIT
jgi:hypothetical protein